MVSLRRLRATATCSPAFATAVVLTVLLTACSGGDAPPDPPASTSVPGDADVPDALSDFLDDVAPHGELPFTARYEVLQKLGGETVEVVVAVDPPTIRIEVEDVVVTEDQTCVDGECARGIDESRLTQFGFSSRFFSDGPAQQLRVDARRAGAGEPDLSTREVAGVELSCAAVPVGQGTPTTACLTPDGVFGYVDDPARRITLVDYQPG